VGDVEAMAEDIGSSDSCGESIRESSMEMEGLGELTVTRAAEEARRVTAEEDL
jgi:hypothetical protein